MLVFFSLAALSHRRTEPTALVVFYLRETELSHTQNVEIGMV